MNAICTSTMHIVVLTGAGISAESGLKTFRGPDGLWEGHRVEEVASPIAWEQDPETVLRFYNQRRQQLRTVQPNAAHLALADLEKRHRVTIVTQNVDDLHERAGSTEVIHLHGELMKARSTRDEAYVVDLEDQDIEIGDLCPLGGQLRPHIVWFGESVPMYEHALNVVQSADALVVIGTSLLVYPAAGLIHEAPAGAQKWVINPEIPETIDRLTFRCIEAPATEGVPQWVEGI